MTSDRHTPPRVSVVSYLNTIPLVWGMLHGPQEGIFSLDFQLPAACADSLASGANDIGILPSIEWARQGLELIPGTGVACRGAVRSILLVSKTPLAAVRTLASDTSSRTSVALARIILSRRYGVEPALIPHAPDLPAMLEAADAALIIGDPALRLDPVALPYLTLDLGAEWLEMTGLPMVFAVWGCRKQAWHDGLAGHFAASCRFGLEHMEDIARIEGPSRGLTPECVREYFRSNVVNLLEPAEYDGLRLFLRYARESGMLGATLGTAL